MPIILSFFVCFLLVKYRIEALDVLYPMVSGWSAISSFWSGQRLGQTLVKLDQNWSNLSKLWEMCFGPRLEVLSIWWVPVGLEWLGPDYLILRVDTRENPGGKNRVMTPSSGNRSSLTKGKSKDHCHSIIKPTPVGHFSQGKNNGSSSGDVKPHQSHFDSHSGVVQSRSHDNLEEHLPTDQGEPASRISSVLQSCVARVAEPMVGVFNGSSSTKSGEDPSVANTTFNFSRTLLCKLNPSEEIAKR